MAAIWIASIFLWRVELNFCYKQIGGGLGILVLTILFFVTPFVLWWLGGKVVFLLYKKRFEKPGKG